MLLEYRSIIERKRTTSLRSSKRDDIAQVAVEVRLLQRSFDLFDEAVALILNLNRTDLRCLDLLSAEGPRAAGELAAGLGLSPAATTTVIDRLERAGWATRTRDSENRRRVLVDATEAARDVERRMFLPVGAAGREALERYDEDQLATILDFLRTARRVQEEQVARLTG